jgi:hypothetical protein
MKILLLGEFSGLHNNLKDGLIELGHEVVSYHDLSRDPKAGNFDNF